MVKVFSANTTMGLEDKINKWIESNEYSIVDIKFSTSMCYCVDDMVYLYSAMVLYEEI